MIILGIESSCDETAAAVVENGTKVLSSMVASSVNMHKKFGGIIPEYAAREQIKCIIPIIQEVIKKSGLKINNLNAIAVTVGPGLVGSLLIGVETAKTLSYIWQKPIIPINHLIAHLYANFLNQPSINHKLTIEFPTLALIVSGGHTELLLMENHGQFKWVGGTRDDAAGECFDKTARLLGFGYPGGPEIEKVAQKFSIRKFDNSQFHLPRPMINEKNFDFSFSGLKTAVLYLLKKHKTHQPLAINHQSLISYEIQEAITDVLVSKTLKAAKKLKAKSILVGGGVSANQRLREKLKLGIRDKGLGIRLFLPKKKWCTDNAATIASAAYFNFKPAPWQKIKPNPSLKIC